MRAAAGGASLVALQGSVIDASSAQRALDDGVCDLVEMTRAQIAEPRLVSLVRHDHPDRVRPCILCNQACQVRDVRNPIVSCIGEPRSGYETTDAAPDTAAFASGAALVVGPGSPASSAHGSSREAASRSGSSSALPDRAACCGPPPSCPGASGPRHSSSG